MPGAAYQLIVKGDQDLFLTGNPEYNFIKQTYKQYKNFAIQQFQIPFKNEVDFGRNCEIDIPFYGDLLNKMYFSFTLPLLVPTSGTYAGWTNSVAHALINSVELRLPGGIVLDKISGLYMEIWNELSIEETLSSGKNQLTGKFLHPQSLQDNASTPSNYIVSLPFSFTENIASSLPLIAMYHTPIKLVFNLNKFSDCIVYDGVTPPNIVKIIDPKLLCDYIYVDTLERLKIKDNPQQYLIKQLQYTEAKSINASGTSRTELTFNHPVSELLFVLRDLSSELNNDWFNFATRNITPNTIVNPLIRKARLSLDNIERMQLTDEYTIRLLNTNRYHTNTTQKHIYCIPFCSEPEKFYPTGSLNFSMLQSPELYLEMGNTNSNLYLFARNYNVITIHDGLLSIGFFD